jgi:hypothetical protein
VRLSLLREVEEIQRRIGRNEEKVKDSSEQGERGKRRYSCPTF